MAGGKRQFAKCYITNAGHSKDWTPKLISSRVNGCGGHHQDKITSQTTHLVVSPTAWKTQGRLVKDALELNRSGGRNIRIVSFDWLDDSWRNGRKNETPYEWEKLEGSKRKEQSTGDKRRKPMKNARKQTNDVEGAKSHVGMMAEVFQESTDKYVDAKERKRIEKQIESQRRVQAEMEKEEREAKEKENQAAKAAAAFQKGAKKARNDIFSENYHIYTDTTGFKYDVTVTKVDTKHNKNERYALTLQIYESNSEPHAYAVNAQFAKTATQPHNNVIAAIGSSFPTALHVFKKCFKEHTRVDWDKRVSFAIERLKREKRNRGHSTGSDTGTEKGVPVSENGVARNASPKEDFASAPFQYHPPAYGPRGELPESEKQKITAIARQDKRKEKPKENEKVDEWINRDSGAEREPVSVDLTSENDVEHELIDVDKDFTKDMDDLLGSYANTPVPAKTDNDVAFVDNDLLTDASGYPFDKNELFVPENATDQKEPSQHLSFNNSAGMPDSFELGTQVVGETQLAERARDELMEFLDNPQIDLRSSILGKRKTSPIEESDEQIKSQKHAEVADNFGSESHVLDSSANYHIEEDIPRLVAEETTDATAEEVNEQLKIESELADGDFEMD